MTHVKDLRFAFFITLITTRASLEAHEINAAEARHVDPLEEIGVNENNARLLDVNAQGSFPYHVYQHHKNPLEEIGVENSNFFDNVHEDPFKGLHDRLKQFWPFGDYKRGWLYDTRRQCPLCDSSVYSYCSEKLFHDSCCCHNSNNPFDRLPYQCQFADCSFLHANSCSEHKLITACCCISNLV